jgi:hypothetical protein
MLIDTEDTAQSIVARLRLLGAIDEQIARIAYLRPQAEFTTTAVDHLIRIAEERGITLVVLDSLGECFGLEAIDENHDVEVGPWLRLVARRLAECEAKPAVIVVDHATKASDNPLHPSGSKRKRAAIGGASYLVTATVPLAGGKGGRLRITCAKDRHGTYATGEHVADLVLKATAVGELKADLYAADEPLDDATLPVILAARAAVNAAKDEGQPMSQSALIGAMKVKAKAITLRGGIDLAVGRGALEETAGPRNARIFTYVNDLPEGSND